MLQMKQQQETINTKKDEAAQKALADATDKINVLDINVEDDFEVDDI